MALTAQQFQDWLRNPSAIRCILVEVTANINGTETQLYLSNRNYVTQPTDTPANTTYLPILKTSVKFTENLSLEGTGSLSYGDIAVDNSTKEYDSWLRAAWQGRAIKIFIGDPKFSRDNFTEIFTGLVANIGSSDPYTLNIQLRDFLDKLNTPITEAVVGNYFKGSLVTTLIYDNPNKEQVKPLVFGEVFNITPVLLDPTELEFMVHNGPIERIIDIRDNGVPLDITTGYTVDLTKGTFKLLNNPAGQITCSVQGSKNPDYKNTVAEIIKRIVKNYGNPSVNGVITDSNIDLVNFSAFETANQQKVGIYISGKDNMLSVCQELAGSVGAQLVATRLGKLKLLKVDVPQAGSTSITDQDIISGTFQVSQKPDVIGTYKLGYCKNYTLQPGLLTGIPQAHRDLVSGEWLSATFTNITASALYRLNVLPEQKNTLMLTDSKLLETDSDGQVLAEATRLVNLRSTQRYIYRFTATSMFLQVQIGDMITVTHSRFGLSAGVAAQVLSTEIDWDTGFINLEVLV
jgi:hypothetical protein